MKKVSLKSTVAIVLMLVVCTISAVAQNRVINNFSDIEDNAKCWAYLQANPTDTLLCHIDTLVCNEGGFIHYDKVEVFEGDTMVLATRVFLEKELLVLKKDTVVNRQRKKASPVLNPALAAKIDSMCVETRFAFDNATNPRLRYDVKWGEVDEFSRQFLKTDGKFVERFGRKDGLNLVALGAYQTGNDISAFSAKGGVMYFGGSALSSFRYLVPVTVGATKTKYSDLAENFAGDQYWAFTSSTGFYWQPFLLDRMDQLRLFFGPEVIFSWYQTDVQTHVQDGITHKVGSWGSSVSVGIGSYLTLRPKYQPWNFILGVKGYQSPEIRLNQDTRRPWVLSFELGVSYNLGEGFGNFTPKKGFKLPKVLN